MVLIRAVGKRVLHAGLSFEKAVTMYLYGDGSKAHAEVQTAVRADVEVGTRKSGEIGALGDGMIRADGRTRNPMSRSLFS